MILYNNKNKNFLKIFIQKSKKKFDIFLFYLSCCAKTTLDILV